MAKSKGVIFGTVGSPRSTPKRPGGSPGGVLQIAELGLGALELGWVQSVRVTDKTCALIKQTAQEAGIALSVHAPYFINFNAQDERILASSVERLLAAARAGYKAGATDIIFHTGSYMKQDPEDVYPIVRKRLAKIVDQLKSEGVDVILRPETLGKGAMFGSLEETIQLSRDIDGVLPCIDIAHLHARTGDGSFNSLKEFTAALKLVKKGLGQRGLNTLHFHMSGIDYGPKGEKKHLPLKESDLKYRDFIKALVEVGGSGRIVCESPLMEVDAVMLQKTYKRYASQAEKTKAPRKTGKKGR